VINANLQKWLCAFCEIIHIFIYVNGHSIAYTSNVPVVTILE
jgi:hypothetical protein